jgi:hypothetical protein
MTDGVTLTGSWSLANRTVSVVIAGLDCGDYLAAADGTVFVPFGADAAGLFTPAYLNQVSNPVSTNPALSALSITNTVLSETITVYVPVIVGLNCPSSGQVLRPVTENQLKTPPGPGVGKLHRAMAVGLQLVSTSAVDIGTSLSAVLPVPLLSSYPNGSVLAEDALFSGVTYVVTLDNDSFDSQICWTVARPLPCTITAITTYLDTEDR